MWTEVIAWVGVNAMELINGFTQVVGGFAILAALTPNKSDDAIVQHLLRVVNFLGGNVGRATNAD